MSFKIVGIGEVLWDLLPGGRQLGGAPANFAYHAGALGAGAWLISRVGRDDLGREALQRLAKLGVPTECVEVDEWLPTGTVGVEIDADGQPHYQIHSPVAWDAIQGAPAGRQTVVEADAVCFGSLAQRNEVSRAAIQALVAVAPATALRIFDINLRQSYYSRDVIEKSLGLANVLKVSDAEWPLLAAMLHLDGDLRTQIQQIADRHSLRAVAYTRGGHGSLLFAGRRWSDHPGVVTSVVDTVGAGDAFTAAMAIGLLAGWDLDHINECANRVAAFVCANAGATPALPDPLRSLFTSAVRPA
ncbi:MAG TPA: carbohydrate kinase [Methylomirabilota bacterium]|nr:carbohydrate kinase [Methylomirabilota bacterium]